MYNIIYFTESSIYNKLGGAATNKQGKTIKTIDKLDLETEELKHEKVSANVGRLILQGRQAKGFTQKDLALVS